MSDNEFDRTPSPSSASYRVQRIDLSWSDWRPIAEPIKEDHVLSMQINEYVTPEEYQQFMVQIKWPEPLLLPNS